MDPLLDRPTAEKELFQALAKVANGFSNDDVIGASANILLNVLRQSCSNRKEAEKAYDELFGKLKSLLLSHYDGAGNRRSVFPFDQVIQPGLIELNNEFYRGKNGK